MLHIGELLEDLHICELLILLRVLDGELMIPLRVLECSTQLSDLQEPIAELGVSST